MWGGSTPGNVSATVSVREEHEARSKFFLILSNANMSKSANAELLKCIENMSSQSMNAFLKNVLLTYDDEQLIFFDQSGFNKAYHNLLYKTDKVVVRTFFNKLGESFFGNYLDRAGKEDISVCIEALSDSRDESEKKAC